jgi:hypothetical protein
MVSSMRKAVWLVGFFLSLLVNPNVACSSDGGGEQWTYSESDMEKAVVGTYSGTVSFDGAAETVTLKIKRAPAGAGSAAVLLPECESRTFLVKPAGACVVRSTMPVVADLSSTGSSIPATHFTGDFTAYLQLEGSLELSVPNSAQLTANYSNGRFSEWSYSDGNGAVRLALEKR